MITIIICFHNEGFIAGWTLDGVERLRRACLANGILTELICVLDDASKETVKVVSRHKLLKDGDVVIQVANRDLGLSRNSGVALARGDFVAILDGDDYYSENWLVEAHKLFTKECSTRILHPQLVVSFGSITSVCDLSYEPVGSGGASEECFSHLWVACAFSQREVFEMHPYLETRVKDTGFGFEDWEWTMRTTAHGITHVAVPNTAIFYRRKRRSMLVEMEQLNAIVRPNPFFSPSFWKSKRSAGLTG